MKAGLITFHDTTNFGSLLQTYGLYRGIENIGHDCEVIDYQCESIVKRELPEKLCWSWSLRRILSHIIFDAKPRKYREFSRFTMQYMKLSSRCTKISMSDLRDRYDKYIVGSDIVWGLDITNKDLTYFLDFVEDDTRKYAFSSSIGDSWTDNEKQLVKPYLSRFNYIAVREDEAANWVEELTNSRPDVVADPTMLIDSSEWESIKSDRYKNKKYVLVYFNSPKNECLNSAIKYAQANGLKVYFINYGAPIKGTYSKRPYSIEDFLSLIYYAQRIFTASYHGMLFSTYFNKQVIYFNRAHKSRMNTLARKLGIEFCDGANVDIQNLPEINYNDINYRINAYREYSYKCLEKVFM